MPIKAFVQARLSPQGYLGLHVTLGALVLVGASWIFGLIAEDVVAGKEIAVVDQVVSVWLHQRTTPTLIAVMQFISDLHEPRAITAAALLIALLLLWRRRWYWLLALALTLPGGGLLDILLKDTFRRQRPVFHDSLPTLASYSFPSGHVMGATLLYGLLAALAVRAFPAWRWRVLAVLCAGFVILLVGFSRIYLGVHYLSDVLAAFLAGVAWLALCLTAVQVVHYMRDFQSRGHGEA